LFEERLRQKDIILPDPPKPVGTYLPAVRSDNLLFVSGMIPQIVGQDSPKGKVGRELTQQEGYDAARLRFKRVGCCQIRDREPRPY
jgi:enamine deaminase RidA (YjgF/YER057c/UK114 family)